MSGDDSSVDDRGYRGPGGPASVCCDAEPAQRPRRRLFVYFFLVGLLGPAGDIAGGADHPVWLASLALAAFAASFVVLVQGSPHHRPPGREDYLHLRRLRPFMLAAMAAIAVASAIAYGSTWCVLFVFVSATFAQAVPMRYATLAIAVSAGMVVAVTLSSSHDVAALLTAASWGLAIVMAGSISLLLRRRDVLIGELSSSQTEVARLAAADAVAEERLRFARDLHDLLGHSLSVIVLKAELARRLLERDEARAQARDEVVDLEQIARRALDEVREAVTGYRARSLSDELGRSRLALEAADIEVRIELAPPVLPADVEALLAWVLRESTTNIVRHSHAQTAWVEVAALGAAVRLEVRDDGVGGAVELGAGLRGLVERVEAAGGRLEAGPGVGGGFVVRAEVPLGAAEPAAAEPSLEADGVSARGAR